MRSPSRPGPTAISSSTTNSSSSPIPRARPPAAPRIKTIEIGARNVQAKVLLEDVRSFELSADGKKLLFQRGPEMFVIDAAASAPPNLAEKRVDLSRWTFPVDPREEWRQMYIDSWRMERDYFYDRNLHNVDYNGLLARYMPFVERVSDRDELNDLLAHLVGELSALHTFVRGGDSRRGTESVTPASLGARLVRDEAAGGYRIEHIYRSDPDYPRSARRWPSRRSGSRRRRHRRRSTASGPWRRPIPRSSSGTRPGRRSSSRSSPERAGRASRPLSSPISPGAESGPPLRGVGIHAAARGREARKGDIGYVHLRAMGGGELHRVGQELLPRLRPEGTDHRRPPQPRREHRLLDPREAPPQGLVLLAGPGRGDDLEHATRLPRPHGRPVQRAHRFGRRGFQRGLPAPRPGQGHRDADMGRGDLAELSNVLVDRGIASAAETGVFGPERVWLIEGHGVDPDIVVDNLPHAHVQG